MDRRRLLKTMIVGSGVTAGHLWIPRIAIAKNRRAGLVESVQVYGDLTAMYNSKRYATTLADSGGAAGIPGAAISQSVNRVRQNNFNRVTEDGCEVRLGHDNRRFTFPAFEEDYSNMQLPFFNREYYQETAKGQQPWVVLLEGPPVVSISVIAEEAYKQVKDREFIRDILYPRYATSRQTTTFDKCTQFEDRLKCARSTVVIRYECSNGVPRGYANVWIYERGKEKPIFHTLVEYKMA
jgi:hypothetical protein